MVRIPPRRNGGLGRRSVLKVKLSGLKIAHARGKYYVYLRATGETLLRGFDGDKEALLRRLSMPDMITAYNRPRVRARRAETFSVETLGGFINWFTNGDIDRAAEERKAEDRFGDNPEGYPKWRTKLAAATRKDYLEAFGWLRDEFDIMLTDITQPDLYDLRDKCANQKWPRFADQMISALSSMFRQAVKRGRSTGMKINPCLGMDKAHEADPNANREWFPEERPAPWSEHSGRRLEAISARRAHRHVLPLRDAQEPAGSLPSGDAGASRLPRRPQPVLDPDRGPRQWNAVEERKGNADPREPLPARLGASRPDRRRDHPARPPRLLCRVVEADRRRQQLGGGGPAGRQVGAHGQALHPARRGGGERHPGLHSGEGRKVNRFCTVLENGSADLENIRCPGAKTL